MLMLGITSPFIDGRHHVMWEWGFKIHPFFLGGVVKSQCFGVKGLTRQKAKTVLNELFVFSKGSAFKNGVSTIAGVIEQGVTNGLHVCADLMRPARLQSTFNQGDITQSFNNLVMGDAYFSGTSVWKNCHLKSVFGMTTNMPLHSSFFFFYVSPNQCDVFP